MFVLDGQSPAVNRSTLGHNSVTPVRLVWRLPSLYFHTDNLFHTRINFFLAVEGLLFAGLCTVWSLDSVRPKIAWVGLAATLLFGVTNLNLSRKLWYLMDCLKRRDEGFRDYRRIRMIAFLDTRFMYTWVVPLAATAGWLTVAVLS